MSLHVCSKPSPLDQCCSCEEQEQPDVNDLPIEARFSERKKFSDKGFLPSPGGSDRGLGVHRGRQWHAGQCNPEGPSFEVNADEASGWHVPHHMRTRSGDLYTKIGWDEEAHGMQHSGDEDSDEESVGNVGGDRLEGEEWITSGGGRYVVKGQGSWGDGSGTASSTDSEGHFSTSLKLLSGRSREAEREPGQAGVARVFGFNKQRGGILLSPRGVTGFKDWYLKRTSLAKATSKLEAPPKSKYIRKLVLSSWKHNGAGAAAIISLLCKLPLLSSPIVTLKAMITVHKLMQQGPAECLVSCYAKLPVLKEVVNNWASPHSKGGSYCPLICAYASMLVEKTRFHHSFPAFANNYSVDFTRTPNSENYIADPITTGSLACLQNIQDDILQALNQGFALLKEKRAMQGDDTIANGVVTVTEGNRRQACHKGGSSDPVGLIGAVLIPVLREADLVYDICWYLISSLTSMAAEEQVPKAPASHELVLMTRKFEAQHRMLRKMFDQARCEPSIACSVAPPNLRPEPPRVLINEVAMDESSRVEALDFEESLDNVGVLIKENEGLDYTVSKSRPQSGSEHDKTEAWDDEILLHSSDSKLLQFPSAGSSHPRQEVNTGPIVGGVGAAAAAAIQRFAAGQAEARRAAASEYPLTPPGGFKNIKLEPPPPNFGRAHFTGLERPSKPQHTRGGGREWSSFDDEVFYHQHYAMPSSPTLHQCPRFLSPREQAVSRPSEALHAAGHGHAASPQITGCESPGYTNFSMEKAKQNKDQRRGHEGTRSKCCLFDGPAMETSGISTEHAPFARLSSVSRRDGPPALEAASVSIQHHQHASQQLQTSPAIVEAPLIQLEVPLIDVDTPLVRLRNPSLDFEQHSLIDRDLRPINVEGSRQMEAPTGRLEAPCQAEVPLIDLDDSRAPTGDCGTSGTEEAFAKLCFGVNSALTDRLLMATADVLETAPASWQLGAASMSDSTAWKDDIHPVGLAQNRAKMETLPKLASVADWEIPASELKLGPKIGQGAFGDVLKGTWQGTDVAVKRLQNALVSGVLQAYEDFRREVALVMRLRHPNIILFMGACTVRPEVCIVMEYAANGSLYSVLHNPNIAIDMATVVRWATEAARGMNYLHTRSPAVVHRDLKSVNLLVDEDWHIKVSDFGLAMTKQNAYAYTQVGTWGWMAPEVLDAAPYDEKADVYSFAVVLWELVTRKEPFKGYHPMQIMRAIDRGERPQIPDSCPLGYKNLIQRCWCRDPRQRPTFEQILEHLAGITML